MSDQPKIRIGNMDTVGGVIDEMKKVYRAARRGELETTEAKRLVDMLTSIRLGHVDSEIEDRLAQLEARNGK